MDKELFSNLLDRYLSGEITIDQRQQLSTMMADPAYASQLDMLVKQNFMEGSFNSDEDLAVRERLYLFLEEQFPGEIFRENSVVRPVHRIHFMRKSWRYVAAVFLFVLAGAGYFFMSGRNLPKQMAVRAKHDVAPGTNGAVLKLSDGRKIMIDTAKDGLIAVQGGVEIYKENGKIIYKGNNSNEVLYNEIETDKGKQWSATLPDGTVAYLNAASSLRYPLTFSGDERLVTMTGEAYFEVVHNEKQPFRVKVGGQVIEDIGTEFNVNAYSDETAIRTTLVKGAASVSRGTKKIMLNPGEQSVVKNNDDQITVGKADVELATAWKNGKFKFRDTDLEAVMRQIARWYDVEIVYEGYIPNDPFTGGTFRSDLLSEVLKVLELNGGVHFTIDGNKVFVKP